MNLDASATCSLLGHLSPNTQPLTQSTAQFTVTVHLFSLLLQTNGRQTLLAYALKAISYSILLTQTLMSSFHQENFDMILLMILLPHEQIKEMSRAIP
jgi:hypothetical protein